MPVPDYGSQTICRPRCATMPNRPWGSVPTLCPWCRQPCWKLPLEPDTLPPGFCAACTVCALRRNTHQREMDAERYRMEIERN